MKTYRKLRVTRIEYEAKIVCDFCHKEIKSSYGDNDEVTIEAKVGNVWPESDHRKVAELDCCIECFAEKVRPCVEKNLGVQFREHPAEEYGPHDRTKPVIEDLGEVK